MRPCSLILGQSLCGLIPNLYAAFYFNMLFLSPPLLSNSHGWTTSTVCLDGWLKEWKLFRESQM